MWTLEEGVARAGGVHVAAEGVRGTTRDGEEGLHAHGVAVKVGAPAAEHELINMYAECMAMAGWAMRAMFCSLDRECARSTYKAGPFARLIY
jgi:hypothetical protein